MDEESPDFDRRLEQLTREVRALAARVDELSARLSDGAARALTAPQPDGPAFAGAPAPRNVQADWAGTTFLAGIAAVCFLLVVALTLRTLVDSRVIDRPAGTFAGFVYAALVLLYGYHRARSHRRFASLAAVCGVSLVLAIVLETHFRFRLLSSEGAYAILASTLVMMAAAGRRYRAYGPLEFAVPSICAAAMSLDFPDPNFVCLGGVMALGVGVAHAAGSQPRMRWLAWCELLFVGFFWTWWTLKLRASLLRVEPPFLSMGAEWYLAGLALFLLAYVLQSSHSAFSTTRPVGAFECAAPIAVSAGAYIAARLVLTAAELPKSYPGWTGTGIAAAYLGLSVWLSRWPGKRRIAASWFTVAALVLLAFSAPDAIAHMPTVLLLWTCAAFALARFGKARLAPFVQLVTILYYVFALAAAIATRLFAVREDLPFSHIATFLAICAICIRHYAWLRNLTRRGEHGAPVVYRAVESCAIAIMLVGLVFAFGAGRAALFSVLAGTSRDPAQAFQCGQSILLNAGALGLALIALKGMRRDLLYTAAGIATLGATKVFAYDLLRTQGVPLVLSVFAFGVTATAGSLIWGYWQRRISVETRQE